MLAAWFLTRHGLEIKATNVDVEGGEIDILARDGRLLVVAEVRTVSGGGDPVDAVDDAKRRRVAELGGLVSADRVDYIGVGVDSRWFDIHWVPGAN